MTGYNSCIDVAEAMRRGVAVDGATSVAEHALAMVLSRFDGQLRI